jgi:hypothetical protein
MDVAGATPNEWNIWDANSGKIAPNMLRMDPLTPMALFAILV